jgi:putative tricarboxylic transport membrane protein
LKIYDIYSGIFLGIVAILTCILSYRLGLGEISNPGPGLTPFGVSSILFLMSLGLVIRCIMERMKAPLVRGIFKDVSLGRVILVLISLFAYGISFERFGFVICTFFILVFLLGVVSGQKWHFAITISVLIVILSYLIFIFWLDIPFPKGPFGI